MNGGPIQGGMDTEGLLYLVDYNHWYLLHHMDHRGKDHSNRLHSPVTKGLARRAGLSHKCRWREESTTSCQTVKSMVHGPNTFDLRVFLY